MHTKTHTLYSLWWHIETAFSIFPLIGFSLNYDEFFSLYSFLTHFINSIYNLVSINSCCFRLKGCEILNGCERERVFGGCLLRFFVQFFYWKFNIFYLFIKNFHIEMSRTLEYLQLIFFRSIPFGVFVCMRVNVYNYKRFFFFCSFVAAAIASSEYFVSACENHKANKIYYSTSVLRVLLHVRYRPKSKHWSLDIASFHAANVKLFSIYIPK